MFRRSSRADRRAFGCLPWNEFGTGERSGARTRTVRSPAEEVAIVVGPLVALLFLKLLPVAVIWGLTRLGGLFRRVRAGSRPAADDAALPADVLVPADAAVPEPPGCTAGAGCR